MKKNLLTTILTVAVLVSTVSVKVEAAGAEPYYEKNRICTGCNKGYKSDKGIDADNPHHGWYMGSYVVEGHSAYVTDNNGNPVFLKNAGDELTLGFELYQNINKLDGNDKWYVCTDKDGYIDEYGIEKMNMGRGMLIVEYTDSNNETEPIKKYRNFLSDDAAQDAVKDIKLYGEGDYKVTLLYEIEVEKFGFNKNWEYRMDFEFSIRNGNSNIYLIDNETGLEIPDNGYTESGFTLDFLGSKYLVVNVIKETVQQTESGYTCDVEYNRTFSDGAEFTEEGIYTITITNQYVAKPTEKVVYVGDSEIMKALSITGLSLEQIQEELHNGATIDSNGNICLLTETVETVNSWATQETENNVDESTSKLLKSALPASTIIMLLVTIIILAKNKKSKSFIEIK